MRLKLGLSKQLMSQMARIAPEAPSLEPGLKGRMTLDATIRIVLSEPSLNPRLKDRVTLDTTIRGNSEELSLKPLLWRDRRCWNMQGCTRR